MANFFVSSLAQLAETPPPSPEQINPDMDSPDKAVTQPETSTGWHHSEEHDAFIVRLAEAVKSHMPVDVIDQEMRGGDADPLAEDVKATRDHMLKKPKDFNGSQRAWERLHGKFKPLSKKWQQLKDTRSGCQ